MNLKEQAVRKGIIKLPTQGLQEVQRYFLGAFFIQIHRRIFDWNFHCVSYLLERREK